MEPENRARTPSAARSDRSARSRTQRVRPLRRRRSAAAPILLAAGIVVVGIALSLLLARTGRPRADGGVSPRPARGPHGASPPEPVVTPMLPAEPSVTPLDEPAAPLPVKARPVEHQR